jgi:RNA-binding protein
MTKHELLKIKIRAEDREDRQKMIDEIVNITQAHLIQVIGNVDSNSASTASLKPCCPTITIDLRVCPRARKNFF